MIATKLKTSSITPSLHILVLRITPTPPAYYGKWEVDIACLERHCFANFGQDMTLKDFLACFAWDDAAYIDAFEKTYIWQEEVEKRIQMDARIKAMARRWHLLVLLMRAKGILKRWFLLAAASAFDAWAPWARRHAFAKKIREEAQKKRVLDLKRWVIKTFKRQIGQGGGRKVACPRPGVPPLPSFYQDARSSFPCWGHVTRKGLHRGW
jgi:hypothetical protein